MQGLSTYSWMQFWPDYWPRGLIVFLSVIQSFLTFFVLSLHTAIVAIMAITFEGYIGSYTVGFVGWAFFLASSIANCCVSCCNNLTFGCATYGAIQNFFTFVFSAVLIDDNRKIITSGSISRCSVIFITDLSEFCTYAIPIAKGLLAVSVFMLLSALIYIGAYIYTLIRVFHKSRTDGTPSNAGRNSGSKSTTQMDSEQHDTPNQNQAYPMQKEKRQPQDVGYRQTEPHYSMQQEQQRAPKARYNQGGVSSGDSNQNF